MSSCLSGFYKSCYVHLWHVCAGKYREYVGRQINIIKGSSCLKGGWCGISVDVNIACYCYHPEELTVLCLVVVEELLYLWWWAHIFNLLGCEYKLCKDPWDHKSWLSRRINVFSSPSKYRVLHQWRESKNDSKSYFQSWLFVRKEETKITIKQTTVCGIIFLALEHSVCHCIGL